MLTGFNDEPAIRVRLIKGSAGILVKGQFFDSAFPIQSGQQASLINRQLSVKPVLDNAEALSLKNGEIYTKDVSIQIIMALVSRWYDVEVRYGSGITENKYTVRVPFGTDLSSIVESLKNQGAHIIRDGRVVTIIKS
jgi:hypothetical protein